LEGSKIDFRIKRLRAKNIGHLAESAKSWLIPTNKHRIIIKNMNVKMPNIPYEIP
jgi:hypothetical protein